MMNQNRKRKSPQISNLAPQNPKISRMDFEKSKSCLSLLKTLMGHPFGWVFNQPVDPVKLQIPDYFIIISCPMDLSTVCQKLVSKKYENTSQFCNDVRLTFSNAMIYNPPGNDVHNMAKELNQIFEKSWKSLEEKWNPNLGQGNPNLGMNGNPNSGMNGNRNLGMNGSRNLGMNGSPNLGRGDQKRKRENPNLGNGNPNVRRENPNARKENPNLWNGNLNVGRENPNARKENPNVGNGNPNVGRGNPNLGNGNPNLERMEERKRRENPSYERENPNLSKRAKLVEEAKPSEIMRKNGQVAGRVSCKGEISNGRFTAGARTEKSNYNRESSNGHTAPAYKSQSISKNANGYTGSSVRPEPTNGYTGSSVRPEPNYKAERSNGMPQTSAPCKLDGPVSAHNRIPINGKKPSNGITETRCSASQPSKCSQNGNGCSSSQPSSSPQCSQNEVNEEEIEMSPRKALRVAMMKKRYAGTIIKAQEKILLDQGKTIDPAKMKMEREKLERAQLEEKARIEAAEKAALEKREQERAAARLELQQMQQTVEANNSEFVWYVEKLQRASYFFNMESIGLFKKCDDYCGSDDEELEEGEIF